MKLIPSPIKTVSFLGRNAGNLAIAGLFSYAALNVTEYALRQQTPSPQTNNMKSAVLAVINHTNGEQTVFTNGALAVGDGIREDAKVEYEYKSIDEVEAATVALIDRNQGMGLSSIQIRQTDIVDNQAFSLFSMGAVPQVCDQDDNCRSVPTARLGYKMTYDAKQEIHREFNKYRSLQAEYSQPKDGSETDLLRKAEKVFYSIPWVKTASDYIYSIRFT